MKARDLRDRTTEDLSELERSLSGESFQSRFKNFTNRLDDTSVIGKNRKDLARVKLILAERARGATVVYKAAEATPDKPKTRPAKALAKEVVEAAKASEETETGDAADKSAGKKKGAAKASGKSSSKSAKAAPESKAAAPKKPKPKTEKGSK